MSSVLRLCTKFSPSGFVSLLSGNSSHGRICALPYTASQNRYLSSSKIKVDLDSSNGVAIMQFQSPPVNSLSLDFLTEFAINLEKLELDRSCRGVIITSAQPKVFSAGLDILEMYKKSPEHCAEFWKAVQDAWLKLYGSTKVTIAAINVSATILFCY
ncbi:enoyl-CoA delta isomerase 1, mitochondrial-like [Sinocyclocheilus rhinocerous]|uniref:Enoyl-CoA delta isomerase 1, mitochondrial-like n=1 Tax=Sinocyclocheilus rhinocerous TaxID=307959 RepID=A0A673IR62_9TELE|nr:PREDICTED: enoyl-CoA delta isomerase 1, mitochondrial-like [Sinocyclocheilus rhinocerous]